MAKITKRTEVKLEAEDMADAVRAWVRDEVDDYFDNEEAEISFFLRDGEPTATITITQTEDS